MAFVVEDGTGLTTSNSYISTASFKSYWADRNVTFTESDSAIQAWLIRATEYSDTQYYYIGCKADIKQALEFPRVGFRDNKGVCYTSTDLPKYLLYGICELAYVLKSESSLTPNKINKCVTNKKIGPLSVTYANTGSISSPNEYGQAGIWFSYISKRIAPQVLPV